MDGPVDTLWIENLNTALDENKMLCLANGQRIKLPQSFNFIFEVASIEAITPATISRCGIVFFEQSNVKWSFYFKKQLPKLKTDFFKFLKSNYDF